MVERALALGERDSFDYVLARALGRTLAEIRQLPQAEFVEWRAFYVYEAAMADFQSQVAAARARRRG